ncbi:MAG: hypothetical protein HRT38_05860 [Alteromonadaceae bacterium]|nr:hypothetical protein [Alteromonadaceae bacterium]
MQLSRTSWNNVMIFSVLAMILLINLTNDRLFSTDDNSVIQTSSEQFILGEHAVILTLTISDKVLIERRGRTWQISPTELSKKLSEQSIEQMMMAWQQSFGLLQASTVKIEGLKGLRVTVGLAGKEMPQILTLFALKDQLLIRRHSDESWLALPAVIYQQLIPLSLNQQVLH